MDGDLILTQTGRYEGLLDCGLRLAEMPEAEGGWAEYFTETEDSDLRIEDPVLRAQTALMLENAKHWMATAAGKRLRPGSNQFVISEATRSATVGGFSDYLFPIIRAAFPTNPINDLVSVQPTNRRTATIIFWNWVRGGLAKGEYVPGQRLFDAQVGRRGADFNFTSEVIPNEPTTALGAAGDTYTYTAKWATRTNGIRPGTVYLTIDCEASANEDTVFTDDGNGEMLCATQTVSASSINYKTGAVSITIAAINFDTNAGTLTYRIDSEGATYGPEVDVQITTSTVTTERNWVMLNFSRESIHDIMAEFGVSLEPQLVSGAAETLNCDIARRILFELWRVATVSSTFSISVPSGAAYNQQQHFRDLIYTINKASATIHKRTQKGYGNWIVCDEGAGTVLESLPSDMFEAAPKPANPQGLHFIGTLMRRFRVYKDIFLSELSGASAVGNMLMGHKGGNFWEAGAVMAPYHMLYATETTEMATFMSQKGMASRWAFKMVSPDMFIRVSLSA